MLTAGRLAGAVIYFLFGWSIGTMLIAYFPEEAAPSFLIPLCSFVGALCGWMIVGKRAGHGYNAATGIGLTGAFAFSFWVVFLLSCNDMFRKSFRKLYDGPMEAIVDVFDLMIGWGQDLANVELIASVVIGSVVCAFVTEFFGSRYP